MFAIHVNIFSCRSFNVRYKWKTPNGVGYRVCVGLGSDPRTNHVLCADFGIPQMRRNIHHVLISTASDCLGEWQFATGIPFEIIKR